MNNKPYVGQIVKTASKILWEVKEISSIPYQKFDDGSCHYVVKLQQVNGTCQDWLLVNDAQIEEVDLEEASDTADKKDIEINLPPVGTDPYWRVAEQRINELAKAINRKTEYMLKHGRGKRDLDDIELWGSEIAEQCYILKYLDTCVDDEEEGI